MRKPVFFIFTLLLIVSIMFVTGCAQSESVEGPALSDQEGDEIGDLQEFSGQELNLYVAAGMKNAMDETIASFEEQSGASVLVNYGPSGGLFAQIEQDQPCDIYYSADWIYIEKIKEINKLEKSLKFLNDKLY